MAREDYTVGDVVNDHVLIGDTWVVARIRAPEDGVEYAAGDIVNGHVWTGDTWSQTRKRKALKKSAPVTPSEPSQADDEEMEEPGPTEPEGKGPGFLERMEAKADELARKADERQANNKYFEKCGRVVAEGSVANRRVKIYEKGFVQVGVLKLGEPERLLGISAQDISQQKTGLGRAAGATVTLGANLLLSPNKRGSLYLVIVTDRKTHNLTASPPTNSDLKAMYKLEGAGRSVLAALEAQGHGPTTPLGTTSSVPESNLAEQLSQLTELHNAGALTDEEFTAAKARLINDNTD